MAARRLRGILESNVPRLRDSLKGFFIFPRVLLSSDRARPALTDGRAQDHVLLLTDASRRLRADDERQPRAASIKEFRKAIIHALEGFPNGPSTPARIGDYLVTEERPSVGPGRVFLGRHDDGSERLLRVVSKPSTAITDREEFEKAFRLREYSALERVAASGRGPRIDPYFSWGDTSWVIPVEPVEGQTLRSVAEDPQQLLASVEDALAALVDLDAAGVIHRAITPDCVWITPTKIIFSDFAFARLIESPTVGPQLDASDSDNPYRPPELQAGHEFAVPQTDVYALAASLVACLTTREPVTDAPWTPGSAPISEVARLIGPNRAQVLAECLNGDERERPTAHQALERWRAAATDGSAHPATANPPVQPEVQDASQPAIPSGPRLIANRYAFSSDSARPGGIADVYEASDVTHPGTRVALKVLRSSSHDPPLIKLFFEREIRSLRALDHPNIVRLLDAGMDPSTGEHYLVLEWMPRDLQELLKADGIIEGWDDFAERIGLPILSALAYAHEHDVVHRDVKPANVLVDDSDLPKLGDFGISHIKTTLATDGQGTLADFASRPFAPPERDAGARFDRDVWGFAVLALASLSDVPLVDYPDIDRALKDLDADPEIIDILAKCVHRDPEQRPPNALALLALLEAAQRRRQSAWVTRDVVYVSLSPALVQGLAGRGLTGADAVRRFIETELGDVVHVRPDGNIEGRIFLHGRTWSFAAERQSGGPRLALQYGMEDDARRVDRMRDQWLRTDAAFRAVVPTAPARAQKAREALFDALLEHERRRAEDELLLEERRLFREWRNQLNAWEEIERRREDPLPFGSARLHGRRFTGILDAPPSSDLEGQVRVVRFGEGGRRRLRGEVETLRGTEVTLFLDRAPADAGGRTGMLLLDTSATRVSLMRQRDALRAVEHGGPTLVRADLPDLLLEPSSVTPPTDETVSQWQIEDLDDAKKTAVRRALGAQDFFLVQGPPGTGKTAFIAELVAQTLRRSPKARVLVTSQGNVALDNALERIQLECPSARLIRLATAQTQVAPEVENLLLEHRLTAWRSEVRQRSDAFLNRWAGEVGIPLGVVRLVSHATELAEVRRGEEQLDQDLAEAEQKLNVLQSGDETWRATEEAATLLEQQASISDRLERLASQGDEILGRLRDDEVAQLQGATADEIDAFLATALAGAEGAADRLVELVGIQARWRERIAAGVGFEEAVLYEADVIAATCVGFAGVPIARDLEFDLCILDEASKATATEALVPFIRARRWILVGDTEQLPPYQEDALRNPATLDQLQLDPDELGRTLFSRLLEHAPPEASTLLDIQHRMVPAIGSLVSECFYGGRLTNARPAGQPLAPLILPRPVTWLDTSMLGARDRRAGVGAMSYANPTEAEIVVRTLAKVAFVLQNSAAWKDRRPSVLVIAGYRPQVAEIERKIRATYGDLASIDVEVKTVDAVQGREADVVLYSVTRSNDRGEIGFLASRQRINVALSRARDALVVIGDSKTVSARPSPLREVLEYIRAHPDDCAVRSAEL